MFIIEREAQTWRVNKEKAGMWHARVKKSVEVCRIKSTNFCSGRKKTWEEEERREKKEKEEEEEQEEEEKEKEEEEEEEKKKERER